MGTYLMTLCDRYDRYIIYVAIHIVQLRRAIQQTIHP